MIIGVSGYARSGKDTVGHILVERHGFRSVSFADKLKMCAYELNPWIPIENKVHLPPVSLAEAVDVPALARPVKQEMRLRRLKEIVDESGWEVAKEVPEVRRVLQRFGTEVGRNVLGENVWVNAAFADIGPEEDIVITDVRFPNEYAAVKDNGGEVWRISRPGITAVSAHVSETAIDGHPFDVWISNDGSIEDLATRVDANVRIGRR